MSQRGGKRPNAGRKKGTPNKATADRQKAVEDSGLTPLDYMLAILRDEDMPTDSRFEAAKAAAPYVHPKLSAVDVSGKVDGELSVTFQTVYEAAPPKK